MKTIINDDAATQLKGEAQCEATEEAMEEFWLDRLERAAYMMMIQMGEL